MAKKLSELRTGQSAVIDHIKLTGRFRKRIMEMGFVPGKEITVVKNAPLKDPIEYKILNYEVSLRRKEAQHVYVTKVDDPSLSVNQVEAGTTTSEHTTEENFKPDIINQSLESLYNESKEKITVAFLGNPNCGKTSLFNACCGTHEHVGNYGGVTVDSKYGNLTIHSKNFRIIDLPGTYSLASYSPEEKFIEEFLIGKNRPDVIINIVDASNLERNLYLTSQLLETNIPMVIALNMYDEFLKSKSSLDINLLSQLLGAPIVPTIAKQGVGKEELFAAVVEVHHKTNKVSRSVPMPYPFEVTNRIKELSKVIEQYIHDLPSWAKGDETYLAVKLLEGDPLYTEKLEKGSKKGAFITSKARYLAKDYKTNFSREISDIITDTRYGFISGALQETLVSNFDDIKNKDRKIDYWLTHKYLGFPIFLLFMYIMFQATFTLGEYPMQWIENGVEWLGGVIENLMSDGPLKDLITKGIIGGVGGVLVFLPNIMILYLFIAIMEDTGYMARAAFIMDKVMHTIGLHGKSFIPLIMGFGCNVPAIMATRTIESKNSRLVTMLILPFMSCSARLPVYILLAGAFFTRHAGLVVFAVYLIGIMFAMFTALLLKKFVVKEEDIPFVMELPPYRVPTFISVIMHMWTKAKQYLTKMGTVILLASIVIWFLGYYPRYDASTTSDSVMTSIPKTTQEVSEKADISTATASLEEDGMTEEMRLEMLQQENSYIGRIGKAIQPIFEPMDYDWRLSVALISGLAAKEIVVSTMGVLYTGDAESGETNLPAKLISAKKPDGSPAYNPVIAFSFMLFVLIYFPCIATVVAIGKESGSFKWALFNIIYSCTSAWIIAFLAVKIGYLFL